MAKKRELEAAALFSELVKKSGYQFFLAQADSCE